MRHYEGQSDEHILGADFMNDQGIERAPGQYPVNDPTFTRDRHLLKTSAGGMDEDSISHRRSTSMR